jgi:ATP-dependent RNA helicase DeaD
MLRAIERATRQPITQMQLPSVEAVNDQRVTRFKQRIRDNLGQEGLQPFQALIEQFEREQNVPALEIAAALARMVQGEKPLLMRPDPPASRTRPEERAERGARTPRADRPGHSDRPPHNERSDRPARVRTEIADANLETFRIEVGRDHKVKPGNIVGAVANEAGLEARYIGRIDIRDDHSYIDLPRGMPDELLQHLQGVWVAGQRLRIKRHSGEIPPAPKIKRGFDPSAGKPDRKGPRPGMRRKTRE